jgi:hypothetical protein
MADEEWERLRKEAETEQEKEDEEKVRGVKQFSPER